MGVFKVLQDKSIVNADSRLFWTPIFVRFPYNYQGKMGVFKVLDDKSIVKLKNGVFLTLSFSTIPL